MHVTDTNKEERKKERKKEKMKKKFPRLIKSVCGGGAHNGQFYPNRRNNAKCQKPQENCENNFN